MILKVHKWNLEKHVDATESNIMPTIGLSRGNKDIDFSTEDSLKTYKRATAPLKDEYDSSSEGIVVFQMQLTEHAKMEGWVNDSNRDIINIPKISIDPNNGVVNIIKEFAHISNDVIIIWASTNLFKTTVDRRVQNNENMKKCLNAAISKECMMDMNLKEMEYPMNKVIIAPLLYKTFMSNADLDNMVTSTRIHCNLQELDAKMIKLKCDVK